MTAKASGLQRLLKLYGMLDNLHAMQVKSAAHTLDEAERTIQQLAALQFSELREARIALAEGSRVESIATERGAEAMAAERAMWLKQRVVRQEEYDAALETHRASRVELCQITEILNVRQALAATEAARRAQAESDDRFLARRVWLETTSSARVSNV